MADTPTGRFWNVFAGVLATLLLASAGWAWNAEGRMRAFELQQNINTTILASHEAEIDALKEQGTDIKLIQKDLSNLAQRFDELKLLIMETL